MTSQQRRGTWITLRLMILGALLYGFTVFQFDFFRVMKRGENGQAAIQMLDQMRRPLLELKQAELRLLQSVGESSAIHEIENAIHDGHQKLSKYLEQFRGSTKQAMKLKLELVRKGAIPTASLG